jgi:hypothetical protein
MGTLNNKLDSVYQNDIVFLCSTICYLGLLVQLYSVCVYDDKRCFCVYVYSLKNRS